jgi:cell pole-organizing protein PopZ
MAAEEKATSEEKSMEDILSSIREIISGETPKNASSDAMADKKKAPDKAKKDEKPKQEDVLELTTKVTDTPPPPIKETPPAAEAPSAAGDVLDNIDAALGSEMPQEQTPSPAMRDEPAYAAPAASSSESTERLLSRQSAEAAAESLRNLVKNIPAPKIESPSFRSGNTLEDIVAESLKPLLAQWLDRNLPVIVERIVEKEVRKLLPDK